jgi:predicted lipoprotein with Yx(FWY)xxD motif
VPAFEETSTVQELMFIRRNRVAGPVALAATALLFAACSNAGTGGAATTPATQTPATQAPATGAASAAPSEEAEAYEVELGDTDALGKFLTGEDGKTLYLFTPDTTTKSNCNTGCIDKWPAFTVESGETVTGGDGVTGKFATITRDDGDTQVTYEGHPLYYFAGDKAAGDVNGEGLNSKWYVVGGDGKAIMSGTSSGKGTY